MRGLLESIRTRRLVLAVGVGALAIGATLFLYFALWHQDPKAVAEAYLSAVARGDKAAAYELISESSRKSLSSPEGIDSTAVGALFRESIVDSYSLGKAQLQDGRASIEVNLFRDSTQIPITLSLVKEGRRWKVEV